jgi:hypothetical protein
MKLILKMKKVTDGDLFIFFSTIFLSRDNNLRSETSIIARIPNQQVSFDFFEINLRKIGSKNSWPKKFKNLTFSLSQPSF